MPETREPERRQPWAAHAEQGLPVDWRELRRLLEEHHDRVDRRARSWQLLLIVLPIFWGIVSGVLWAIVLHMAAS